MPQTLCWTSKMVSCPKSCTPAIFKSPPHENLGE